MTQKNQVQPLAPFNQANPSELAVLAVLLSKGNDPAQFLPQAASLWAQAYQYCDELRCLFWGPENSKRTEEFLNKSGLATPQVWSFGPGDTITVNEACAKYSWGERHLRELFRANLPPHIFKYLWKAPPGKKIQSAPLPKILLERVDRLQAEKRAARAQKAVKHQ